MRQNHNSVAAAVATTTVNIKSCCRAAWRESTRAKRVTMSRHGTAGRRHQMKNSVVFLTMFLTVGATCAAPDDAWSLSGNMQTNSNPGPWVNGGRWRYHYDDPSQDFSLTAPPNGYEASLPDEGYGWVASAGSHLALVRFTVDADGGDGTTFRAGQVGGHAVIGASWETDHAGKFLIDYLGYNARVQTGGGADGRETDLVLRVGGIEHERTVITSGVYGSGNPYTKSLTVVLNAGDVIDLTHFQHDAGATDWVGLDMTITPVPATGTIVLIK